ncbi:glutamate synthase large subunit [Natrinema hispanicum]|uniref:Glutamate synthase (NADPH) large subunit n=1 Tax=Natrinema hispanicum TaxID=392421 RepID=A0A1I0ABW7_9EURY|nr:glutamate synthase large subunit [Natrinema hispanicum]SDB99395.1 glutamate synthase (NADPH) large subunit [Natrinema hispanicum]SES90745.1 glutamate synthase (NADPH/NADH) large chain [Natrinema hispanicum]
MSQPHLTPSTGRSQGLADPMDARSNCGVGVVMDLDGDGGHDVVADGLELLRNLEHRGTTGAEKDTGDGAGIMLQTPDSFFQDVLEASLPDTYAVGSLFLPQDDAAREALISLVEDTFDTYDLSVLEWRDVPTNNDDLGKTAVDSEPDVWQVVVTPDDDISGDDFDRRLYVARRALENKVETADIENKERFYVVSLDSDTVVYKGLLKGEQVPSYYPDLTDERMDSTFAMVHERFSTNTLGAWHLAHPYRNIIHNGEFNTIQGNINWMRARETDLESEVLEDLEAVKPIIDDPDQSDTASVDNALELLMQDGRDLEHALRMLVPEAWRGDDAMDADRKDWYDFHASLVEPWDGPALVAATDGERVGAVLDRNGLRPCRYDVTTDNRLIMASEAGALETDPAEIEERGRLKPGQLFLADPNEGRVIPDEEVFEDLTDDRYGEWVAQEQVHLDDIQTTDDRTPQVTVDGLRDYQAAFGYTHDELENLIEPMTKKGKDPVGSMGDDTPLSVLTEYNRPLFSYFKQLFAQVTNPPLDYIREELVTSMESRLGVQRNLLDESPAHARQLVLDSPVLTDAELASIRDCSANGITAATIDITYEPETDELGAGLEAAIERVRADTVAAIEDGHDVIVLSDRSVDDDRIAIPSLLATGAVHHHLVRNGLRNHVGLVVESADPRTVHHFATLVGYGAGAVNPYLAYQTIEDLTAGPDGADAEVAIDAYVGAVEDGLLKIMAKMGISTVESYQGAQIFEAVGLDSDLVAEYFEGTENRTEGIGLAEIEEDLRERHATAFDDGDEPDLTRHGEFEHRSEGIHHQWNPQTVGALQQAVRSNDYERYQDFADQINDQQQNLQTLRGLLEFDSDRDPVPLEDVEPITDIVQRFSTAAMSLGSLSPEAHENNSIAMNRIGGKSNSGEGGEPPERFGTEKECNVKQVASGRFGVTSTYLSSADELQIKMAQGSKPGEGGHLPGEKVNEMIAHVRKSTPGVGLISPPPLHDIYSIEDLKQLIFDLKAANEEADINVKLVSEAGIGTVAAGVAKANADVVHISGHSGGTGASPRTSIKNAGLPWELGLAEANQMLCQTGLRDRIRVSADGGMKTGRDVAVAALLGAEEYVFGTASLVTSGCVMARQCHNNTCPVGVATQREDLRKRFPGEPEHVINYMTFIAQELRELMAELGFETLDEMIGHVDVLEQRDDVDHPKARNVDLSAVLADPGSEVRRKLREQDHELEEQLDRDFIAAAADAIENQDPVSLEAEVTNVDRTVGAMLSNRITDRYGEPGLPEDTITVDLEGTAGQSFGAFLASGVSMHLDGSANDYVGKGLSGGKLTIRTPETAAYDPTDNVAIGNVALYGATNGQLYVNGVAGERFAVRNSGAKAVVEGVGDHGCEYMTGGVVAVLGDTGTNFAAGMSGGVAYVYDPDDDFAAKANTGMVSLHDDLEEKDEQMLRRLVENHVAYTGSERGQQLLNEWEHTLEAVVKVMPEAYAEAISEQGSDDVRNELPGTPEANIATESASFAASDD